MGGTFIRLVDQGHEVHVAYQTSGNIAVFDDDAIRFADFVRDFNEQFGLNKEDAERFYKKIVNDLKEKHPGQIDSPEVLRSEEHTSELQSRENLVCRLLL